MKPPAKPPQRHANLVARISEPAKTQLERLADQSGQTQAAVVERLILATLADPDSYYLRSAAINAFTAAALARVVLGVVASDHPQLSAALEAVDGVSRGLFGELPPAPDQADNLGRADPRVASVLNAFGLLDRAG